MKIRRGRQVRSRESYGDPPNRHVAAWRGSLAAKRTATLSSIESWTKAPRGHRPRRLRRTHLGRGEEAAEQHLPVRATGVLSDGPHERHVVVALVSFLDGLHATETRGRARRDQHGEAGTTCGCMRLTPSAP